MAYLLPYLLTPFSHFNISLRNLFRRPWSSTTRLDDKTVLITGATTGIGKETALDLAKRGARIIMACRDMEKSEGALKEVVQGSGSQNVVIKKIDLSDTKSIREFAETINKEETKLNILINNAGVMVCPYGKTADGFKMQTTQHLIQGNHFLLTHLLIDLIKRSTPARIINVSSLAHFWGTINLDDINSEKGYLANVLFTSSLAKRLQGTAVTAYTLHPGIVQTDLWRHLDAPQAAIMKMISPFTKTSVQGAQTTIYCAVAPELETESGGYYRDCAPANYSRSASDDGTAQKLWELSCRMLSV
uniref:Retinol dehydrogenase 12, like n=1 Tax=Hucho hucho TaxID=62062 RepID=A0A4W5LYN1_9TELE